MDWGCVGWVCKGIGWVGLSRERVGGIRLGGLK